MSLPTEQFTLRWEHSIEHTEWREVWAIAENRLQPLESWIVSHGIGMQPNGPILRHEGKFIVYQPETPPQETLNIPDSDFSAPMQLCLPNQPCRPLRAYFPTQAPALAAVMLSAGQEGVCPR